MRAEVSPPINVIGSVAVAVSMALVIAARLVMSGRRGVLMV